MKTISFELFLTRDPDLQQISKKEILKSFGTKVKSLTDVDDDSVFSDCFTLTLRVPEEEIWNTARRLIQVEGVLGVDPDLNTSVDKSYQKVSVKESKDKLEITERPHPRWFHGNIRFEEAVQYAGDEYRAGRGSFNPAKTTVMIAQFDTGYTNHPEIALIDKKAGYNYIAGFIRRMLVPGWQRDARDRLRNLRPIFWASHGTSTASTIIGTKVKHKDEITGQLRDRINGLLPHNIDLIPFRISENIISFNNKMIHAIDQVIKNGDIRIVTMSHASLFSKQSWKHAVEKAYNNGIIWIAAGGSHAFGKLRSIIVYPAKYKETIATAASTVDDVPWERTHYGEEIDICAPGFDMYVPSSRRRFYGLWPNRYMYKWSEGTSFSTPITATAAALWMAHHGEEKLDAKYHEPWQRVEAFRKVLKESARPHKAGIPENKYGSGLLDVLQLLKMDLPEPQALTHAYDKTRHESKLVTTEEKLNHITNKEIMYLLGCAKILEQDMPDESLFRYVYQHASVEARKLLDIIVSPEKLTPGISNPKSEAIKVYAKEFLNSWA
jgi:hypothetical protein